jgi:hypothetical protein
MSQYVLHGSNTRNLSVQPSSSQTSKNTMSFLLSLMFSLQQNQRTRGRNKFCLEVCMGVDQAMYTHVSKCKNDELKKLLCLSKKKKKADLSMLL